MYLSSVAVNLFGTLVAVGSIIDPQRRFSKITTEVWNGHAWSIVAAINPGYSSYLKNIASIPGTSSYWAVGQYSPTESFDQTLIESYC